MATTMTRSGRHLTPSRERVFVEELDRLVRIQEDTSRVAALIAEDLGYERVRINHVEMGDALFYTERGQNEWRHVEQIDHRTDEVGSSWFAVSFKSDDHGAYVRNFEDGEFVSRKLPDFDEPF